jgi:short subunit dehydrogenase-like uncharacterized protein
MAKRVTDLAMQLHGANGYTEEYGLERLHRDAHGWALAGGTPAMQRIRIVSELLGRRFDQRGVQNHAVSRRDAGELPGDGMTTDPSAEPTTARNGAI